MNARSLALAGAVAVAVAPGVARASWDNNTIYHYFPDQAASIPPNIAAIKNASAQTYSFPYDYGLMSWPATIRIHVDAQNQVTYLVPPALPTMYADLMFQGILVEVSSDPAPTQTRLRYSEFDMSQQSTMTFKTSPLYPTYVHLAQLQKLPLGQNTFTIRVESAQGVLLGQLPIDITTLQPAYLDLSVNDVADGLPTTSRVSVSGNGLFAYSDQAFPVYDEAYGSIDYQKNIGDSTWPLGLPTRAFYSRGQPTTIAVRPGTVDLVVSKGLDYARYEETMSLAPGETVTRIVNTQRVFDLPQEGWFSLDDHVHVARDGTTDDDLVDWCSAEDLNFANLSQMGDISALYYQQSIWGLASEYQKGNYLIRAGQEDPRTQERGHALMIGNAAAYWDPSRYYIYEDVFGLTHMDGGLGGYAHNGLGAAAERGFAIDGPLAIVDFMEFYFKGPAQMTPQVLYNRYNLGEKLTALAGSDFPLDPFTAPLLGITRAHVYLGPGNFSFANLVASIAAGATYATNGPLVDFTVNGALPGSELSLSGAQTLNIQLRGRLNPTFGDDLVTLEIISQGNVIATKTIAPGEEHDATLTLPFQTSTSCWIAAKVSGQLTAAHTTAIYVTIDGAPFWDAPNLASNAAYQDGLLAEVEGLMTNGTIPASQTTDLQSYIDQARTVYDSMQVVPCPSFTFTPANLPSGFVGRNYKKNILVTGGVAPYSYAFNQALLPPGFTIVDNGSNLVLKGKPVQPGAYPFTIDATDSSSPPCMTSHAYTMQFNCQIRLNQANLVAQVGQPYSAGLSLQGGTGPFTYSIASGALPPGLTLDAQTGVISGTPTTAGTFSFNPLVADAYGCSAASQAKVTVQ